MRELCAPPDSWDNGSLLPADPHDYNTGIFGDRLKADVFTVWARHLEFLSHAGSITWRYSGMDPRRLGPSIAFVSVTLPEDVRRYGPDRYMVLLRDPTGFEPVGDLPADYPDDIRVLLFTDQEWEAFLSGAKDHEFDLNGGAVQSSARAACINCWSGRA